MSPFGYHGVSLFPLTLGGDERDRTDDPLLAKQVLSHLSYTPINGSKLNRRSFHALHEPQKLNNDFNLGLMIFRPS